MSLPDGLFTPPSAETAKRPYVAPALIVHGDVQALTQLASPGPASPDQSGLAAPHG